MNKKEKKKISKPKVPQFLDESNGRRTIPENQRKCKNLSLRVGFIYCCVWWFWTMVYLQMEEASQDRGQDMSPTRETIQARSS